MTKNCAFCGRKFVSVHPRHRFCGRPCREKAEYERLPNTGSGSPSTRAMSHYWLTAKGYKAIGKRPPRAVVKTDRELGLL